MSHYRSRLRAEQALTLRSSEYLTWQEVADRLNFRSASAARTAVSRLLTTTRRPTVGEMRAEHRESLRVLRRRQLDHLAVAEAEGDIETATRITREIRANLDSAAKLDGLAEPQRTEVAITVSRSPAEIIDSIRAELAALPRQQRQHQLGPAVIEGEVIDTTEETAP
jgi:hypothetical protein